MTDFIEEVEEQLRSDRYRALALRYAPWFVAALIAIVAGWLGAWGWRTMQDRDVAKASVSYDKALETLAQGDETGAFNAFAAIGKSGPPAYRTLALIQEGNLRLAAGKTSEAVALFDQAAKAAPNPIFGDLARLKAALALLDTTPLPQLQTRLTPLIGETRPYNLQAREALAMAKLLAGRTAEARSELSALTLTLGVPDDMKKRLQAGITLIDSGQAKVAAEVVKTVATLPPPSPGTVTAPPEGPPPPEGAAPDGAPQGPGSPQ